MAGAAGTDRGHLAPEGQISFTALNDVALDLRASVRAGLVPGEPHGVESACGSLQIGGWAWHICRYTTEGMRGNLLLKLSDNLVVNAVEIVEEVSGSHTK